MAAQADYLPLETGARWTLTSASSPTPMVFEVTDLSEGTATVRWDNPWVEAEFQFARRGTQVLLTGLDMGAGRAPMPPDTVYFDFGPAQGTRWTNQLGELVVAERGATVVTPSGTYRDATVIRLVDPGGARTTFTFAPNVGFVRFGEGRNAFLLTSYDAGQPSASADVADPPNAPSGVQVRLGQGPQATSAGVHVGMDFNPASTEGFSDEAKRASFARAVEAGLNFVYMSPKWNEIEPAPGRYDFSGMDFMVGLAEAHDLPVSINFRIIDTGNSAVPSAYSGWSLDDPRMVDRLSGMLRAASDRLKGRARWVTLGNEVNGYFDSRQGDVAAYARLISQVAPVVRERFGRPTLMVNFTADAAVGINQRYRALTDQVDAYSFTYYPLNADFTMRPPDSAARDIARMLEAAGDKPLVLQEVGYASAARLNSSPDAQATFLTNVFAEVRKAPHRFAIVHVLFMSDLPDAVVEDLTRYYRLANSDNFKAYLSTLGLRDSSGTPKPAWQVFQREARQLGSGG